MPAGDVLRIANCSGFYGDRLAAAREMVEGGPLDVLTGDYLAELTLMILFRDRLKSPGAGYARTFLRQMEEVLGTCVARGIKIVANAGGLNPAGLAAEVEQLATRLGVRARIAHVEGDDLLPRLADLQARGVDLRHLDQGTPLAALDRQVVTANAYLGAWGIVEALGRGADVVICPRVTDAALTLGPAAWKFGWARPGARLRRPRRAAPADHEGLHQLSRRLPELDDLRAGGARRRGEGRDRRADAVGAPRRPRALRGDRRAAGALGPARPALERRGVRLPAGHGEGPGCGPRRPRV